MTNFELGWLVGIIEGEGCFTTSTNKQGIYPRIEVTSTDTFVVQRCFNLAGGHINGPYPQTGRFGNKEVWRWRLSTKAECVTLIELILPHLSERRAERARQIIGG